MACRKHADVVVASIYVNPTQFSANEDFDVYPRDPVREWRSCLDLLCAGLLCCLCKRSTLSS